MASLTKDVTNPKVILKDVADSTPYLGRHKVTVNWYSIGGVQLNKGAQDYPLWLSAAKCEGDAVRHTA